jgi:hypothetical protein
MAALGIVITHIHENPSIQTIGTAGLQLVHVKFDFVLETLDHVDHQRQFRLKNDALEFRTRSTYGARCLARMNEFADAEAAYHALDKETRGPFKTEVTIRPLEVVHTPEGVGKEAGEVVPERFWKVKLVRPRVAGVRKERSLPVNFR